MNINRGATTNISLIVADAPLDMRNNDISDVANADMDTLVVGSIEAGTATISEVVGDLTGVAQYANYGFGAHWGLYHDITSFCRTYDDILRVSTDTDYNTVITVGPPVSGATEELSIMSSVPVGAKAIRLYMVLQCAHGTGVAGTNYMEAHIYPIGEPKDISPTMRAYANAVSEVTYITSIVETKLDINRIFRLFWSRQLVSGGYGSISLAVLGYYQ